MNQPVDKRQVTFPVSGAVYANVDRMAKAAGMATGTYVATLFQAAYAARCKVTGDVALDAAVERVVLLHGTKEYDTDEIARNVGLSESAVIKIIDAWRAEAFGRSLPVKGAA
jgi:hypothetical protein